MIELKTGSEMDAIARGGELIASLYAEMRTHIVPGVSTLELDVLAETFIRDHRGAEPAFKGLYGFPGTMCCSINEEVVHGIPSPTRILEVGDILSLDTGVRLDGWCSDSAWTFAVGEIASDLCELLRVTEAALDRAIDAARPGNHVGDIGHAVQTTTQGSDFAIIRDLVGHGIGRKVHEDPQVPNLGSPGEGPLLREGMVLAIEPMIAMGTWRIRTLPDRWTMVTADSRPSAHFEHTVGITAMGPRILTAHPDPAKAGIQWPPGLARAD